MIVRMHKIKKIGPPHNQILRLPLAEPTVSQGGEESEAQDAGLKVLEKVEIPVHGMFSKNDAELQGEKNEAIECVEAEGRI